jgi:hypothetical protein
MTNSNLPPISFGISSSNKNEPLTRQAPTFRRRKRKVDLSLSFVKEGVKPDETVVARLLELKPFQSKSKLRGVRASELIEFDNLLVNEIERGVSPVELAFLLKYSSSGAITKRYKDIKIKYSLGFNQAGEVMRKEKNA